MQCPPNNSGMIGNSPPAATKQREAATNATNLSHRTGNLAAIFLLAILSVWIVGPIAAQAPAPPAPAPENLDELRKMNTEVLLERARTLAARKQFQNAIAVYAVLLERRPELREERHNLAT